MTKCRLWAVGWIVLVGMLGSTCRVEATRIPAVLWHSGDHDIYQACDRTSPSGSSAEPVSPRVSPSAGPTGHALAQSRTSQVLGAGPEGSRGRPWVGLVLWLITDAACPVR
jgi:hypothetical protein